MILVNFIGYLIGSVFRLIFAIVYIFVAWWSIGVLLYLLWNAVAPWWIEIIAGIVFGAITVPLAIIGYLLAAAGVIHPPLLQSHGFWQGT